MFRENQSICYVGIECSKGEGGLMMSILVWHDNHWMPRAICIAVRAKLLSRARIIYFNRFIFTEKTLTVGQVTVKSKSHLKRVRENGIITR